MTMTTAVKTTGLLRSIFRSWFDLTANEQKAIMLVLGIFLLGLAARTWQIRQNTAAPTPPPAAAASR